MNPLQAIYRHAVRRELVVVNPTREVDLPAARGRREKIATATQAARLIAAIPESDRVIWATAFYAGLRRGELQALRSSRSGAGAGRPSPMAPSRSASHAASWRRQSRERASGLPADRRAGGADMAGEPLVNVVRRGTSSDRAER